MKEIPLQGRAMGMVVFVDDDDYEKVSQFKWYLTAKGGYARTQLWRRGPNVTMHKFLTGYEVTDHKNGNRLDNRRRNLRDATPSQNQHNKGKQAKPCSSIYKGVCFDGRTNQNLSNRWVAHIRVNGNLRWLGRHASEEEAARAYDKAALEEFGEFARPNFPVEVG